MLEVEHYNVWMIDKLFHILPIIIVDNNKGECLYRPIAHTCALLCALHTHYPCSLDLFIHIPFQLYQLRCGFAPLRKRLLLKIINKKVNKTILRTRAINSASSAMIDHDMELFSHEGV